MIEKECSILILSRDASVRQAYLTSVFFRKYWADCPYTLYLCTQEIVPEDNKYDKVIYTDKSMEWGGRLQKALEQIESEYVILCPEDDFLQSTVNTEAIHRCIEYAKENNVGAIRLCPPMLFTKPYNKEYDIVPEESIYRLVLHPMLFEARYLRKFAEKKYTPWQFEREGSAYSREMNELVFCSKMPLYNSVHAWSRGMWTQEGYQFLVKSNIDRSLYDFAKVYPWYMKCRDDIIIFIIKTMPHLSTKLQQCRKNTDEKKLKM